MVSQANSEEPPATLDETSTHGALVGGLVWVTSSQDIAESYERAAEVLIDVGITDRTPWNVAYPVLFLYRHAVELFLKTLLAPARLTHSLPHLIQQTDAMARVTLPVSDADWLKQRLTEFVVIDPQSTAFRFANTRINGEQRCDGEWWVDFAHLRQTMATVFRLLDLIRLGYRMPQASGEAMAERHRPR